MQTSLTQDQPRTALQDVVNVSVLVLAKNEEKNIGAIMEALFSQDVDENFEVVFIDSGSKDRTVEIAKQYPIQFHEIPPEEFHHSRTRNLAASLAQGKYLIYLAGDAIPTSKTWMRSLLENFKDDSVMAVYGRHLPKPGSEMERQHALGTLYGPERVVKDPASRDRLGYKYFHFSTVNAAIRKEAWEATGFPNDLKVFEDIAIAKAILDRGWTIVYEPNATVYHSHDYPAGKLLKRYFDIGVIYKQLGIWDAGSGSSMRSDGVKGVFAKFKSLRPGTFRSSVRAIVNDVAKASGMLLGKHENMLPLFAKRRLSAFKIFG